METAITMRNSGKFSRFDGSVEITPVCASCGLNIGDAPINARLTLIIPEDERRSPIIKIASIEHAAKMWCDIAEKWLAAENDSDEIECEAIATGGQCHADTECDTCNPEVSEDESA